MRPLHEFRTQFDDRKRQGHKLRALRTTNRDDFIPMLTSELPERPGYFALEVEINRAGASVLLELPPVPALHAREFLARQQEGR